MSFFDWLEDDEQKTIFFNHQMIFTKKIENIIDAIVNSSCENGMDQTSNEKMNSRLFQMSFLY